MNKDEIKYRLYQEIEQDVKAHIGTSKEEALENLYNDIYESEENAEQYPYDLHDLIMYFKDNDYIMSFGNPTELNPQGYLKLTKKNHNQMKNTIIFKEYDYKEDPSNEDYKELVDHAIKVKGEMRELYVFTADTRIFVSGPKSFFKWLNENHPNDCAQELFSDTEYREDDEGNEQTVTKWFMKDNLLYVEITDQQNYLANMPYSLWVDLNEDGDEDE